MSSAHDDPSNTPLADHSLPPVEPPSPRFIIQLFVVPGVIVTIIVAVWLLFNWLAEMGADPNKYVAILASNSKARWQAAENLAVVLNDEKNNKELKRDAGLARALGTLLADELKKPNGDQQQACLEAYLCRALGLFEVPEAVPPLVAAATQVDPHDIAVRRAALEGLALLASNLPAAENEHQAEMDAALAQAATDADPQIRCVAAFALGVERSEKATTQLVEMLSDIYPDVRYNAAAGLARHHNPAGFLVILEMLDPEEARKKNASEASPDASDPTAPSNPTAASESKAASETNEKGDFKQSLIVGSGLQAAGTIYAALDDDQRQTLRKAVERLEGKDQAVEIRLKAADTLRLFDDALPASSSTR